MPEYSVSYKKKDETRLRSKLSERKPLAYAKIMQYEERAKRGESNAILDISYDYTCNLHCKHCLYSQHDEKGGRAMTVDTVADVARQADELGLAQFVISGGEPLVFKELDDIVKALTPDKFHISMSTNGMSLDRDMACHLEEIGLDKIKISLDSIKQGKHDDNRNSGGVYQKAVEALSNAKDAGLDVIIQHVLTHQDVGSPDFIDLCEYAGANGYAVDLMIAKPLGEWEGRYDLLIDEDDAKLLRDLHEKYPFVRRDIRITYDVAKKCGTVDSCLHITKYGDVQPCVFIPVSIGNIHDERLKDIIDTGFNIKYFRDSSPICLSGEDRGFIKKYIAKTYGRPVPVHHSEIFEADDYINPPRS